MTAIDDKKLSMNGLVISSIKKSCVSLLLRVYNKRYQQAPDRTIGKISTIDIHLFYVNMSYVKIKIPNFTNGV